MKIEKITNKRFDPISFERPLSEAYRYSRIWIRDLPESVRITTGSLRTMNMTLDPRIVEEESEAFLEKLCSHSGTKTTIDSSAYSRRKKQLKGFIVYADAVCDQSSEILSKRKWRGVKQTESFIHQSSATLLTQDILKDLDIMMDEQDEPDFRTHPTEYASQLARRLITKSYTHYIGTSPVPSISPDGEGGLVIEWKRDRLIVRLVVSPSQEGKSYVYSRGPHRSLVEHSVSGLVLAQQLSTIFSE